MAAVGECRIYDQATLKSLFDESPDYNPLLELGTPIEATPSTVKSATKKNYSNSTVPSRKEVKQNNTIQQQQIEQFSSPSKKIENSTSRREKTQLTLNKARLEKYEQQQREADLQSKQRIETQKATREKKFNYMYDTVFNGMMDPSGILNEVDTLLATNDNANLRKKEALYKEWKENVYDRIHGAIQEQVDAISTEEIEKRHRDHFEAYLNTITKKGKQHYRGGVFRDVIIESDYDPLVPRSNAIKISTTGMVDPLKRDLRRQDNEKQSMGLEVVSHGPCPGKTMFPVTMYHQAEATPAGHFSMPDGTLKEPLEQYKATSAKKNLSRCNETEEPKESYCFRVQSCYPMQLYEGMFCFLVVSLVEFAEL
mmetsp:Transcript_29932/g.41433  ORF Transcript_29932/g.41433 Transcript_29932/m.41433 type:complete len:368 (+) Transcript_29932:293-1396(+)